MSYLKVVIIAVMFVITHTAMAGATLFENATIRSVDVENNTFTVKLEESGITKTYSFPENINLIDEGVALIDKSAIKEGQPVNLKFESEGYRFANPGVGYKSKKRFTLKGMTIK